MNVRWRRNAQLDLAEIDTHTRLENPQAANRIISAIRKETVQLSQYPLLGRLGRIEDTRELVVTNLSYIVAHQVTSSAVEILAVIHTSRLWPESFSK